MGEPLVLQNLALLDQGRRLLGRLDAETYGPSRDGGAGVGPHVRHCLDFYQALLRGWPVGRVDYDRRERDARLESDPRRAAAACARVATQLAALPAGALDRPLEIVSDDAGGTARRWSRSSLGRELRFLLSHTVHHYALIALLLRQREIDPGAGFGVAPATLAHRDRVSAGGRADPASERPAAG